MAQKKKSDRLSGTIKSLEPATKTIKMQMSTGPAIRTITYDENTTFTLEKKPAGADALKEGLRIVAAGQFEGVNLKANRIALYLK